MALVGRVRNCPYLWLLSGEYVTAPCLWLLSCSPEGQSGTPPPSRHPRPPSAPAVSPAASARPSSGAARVPASTPPDFPPPGAKMAPPPTSWPALAPPLPAAGVALAPAQPPWPGPPLTPTTAAWRRSRPLATAPIPWARPLPGACPCTALPSRPVPRPPSVAAPSLRCLRRASARVRSSASAGQEGPEAFPRLAPATARPQCTQATTHCMWSTSPTPSLRLGAARGCWRLRGDLPGTTTRGC